MNYADWTLEDAIKKRVELEDQVRWSLGELADYPRPLTKDYRPLKVRWSETAKFVFGRGIHYFTMPFKV